ncbi:MAG: PD-(D/E)XK nuclease family protein [Leptolyngbya sp. SIO3F4]|nr:PD-(D/E)XK nuclease family protein [Leptolyngbya sp. SIO3F4]
MNDINKIEAVTERDMDLLVLEELNVCNDFASWFYSKSTHINEAPKIKGAWHSIADSMLGESGLIAIYENDTAILIENKIDAVAQPEQGIRYKHRGAKGITDGRWKDFTTCMIAPALYLQEEQDVSVYGSTISYEEISKWFIERNNLRSTYKSYLINEGVQQNRRGYTIIPNELVTDFWSKYWSHAAHKYPELEMKKPGLKPANSDWPAFRPSSLDKRFSIVHKLQRGDVDLQIAGAFDQVDKLTALLSKNYDVEVVQAGKSAAIRLKVHSIDRFKSFESQYDKVTRGLNSARELLSIGQEIIKKI